MAFFLAPRPLSLQAVSGLRAFHYFGAIVSGLTLTLAFPPPGISWLAWIAFVPILKAMEGQGPRSGIKLGFIFGLVHFGTLLYWIVYVVGHYGGLNLYLSILPFLLLICYLALYPAAFCGLCAYLQRGKLAFLTIPLAWTALEFMRAKLFTGFPWCLVGYSQYKHLLLIQISSVTGVYGLSFLILLANCAVFKIAVARKEKRAVGLLLPPLATILAISITLLFGKNIINQEMGNNSGQGLNVLIVQPSIDQSQKWNPSYQRTTVEILEKLTQQGASQRGLDIIVWPETALPFFFQKGGKLSERVRSLCDQLKIPIIFGSPAYEYSLEGRRYFNRAYLMRPGCESLQWYDKVHLVPFGEYVPLKKVLFFVQKLVHGAGDFMPGSEVRPLVSENNRFGILICFEAIFPEISRQQVTKGARCLVNLTNDAWFGRSSAPYQHLAMSVFRAVENRVPLIRAANTGISAVVSSTGHIVKKSGLFTKEIIISELVLPSHPLSPYTVYGDLFALICLVLSGVAVAANFLKK